jgi:hypothetical protein
MSEVQIAGLTYAYIFKRWGKKVPKKPEEKERNIRVKCFGQIKMIDLLGVCVRLTPCPGIRIEGKRGGGRRRPIRQ